MYLCRSFRIFYPARCMRNYVTMHHFIGRRPEPLDGPAGCSRVWLFSQWYNHAFSLLTVGYSIAVDQIFLSNFRHSAHCVVELRP